ncbi:MAG: peptide ABC transporter substrate-binding protein [Lentisphaerae bacterium GWF2_52_8]|nr:MAG: peptide ABC transporter substrate-binding protein [Lentisphaerae bacterium GWF2_52_8]
MALLEVRDLKTWYPVRGGLFSKRRYVKAVDGVSLSMEAGETVGLVGESGCGKSTLGRTLMRLENPSGGEFSMDGVNLASLRGRELREMRRKLQMIFQDPYGSLNPRMRIQNMLDEVLRLHTNLDKNGRRERMSELLKMVGLPEETLPRYPHQFSGGQRQRLGIARALAVNPKLIIADEPVSALDVSVQAQIITLLQELQKATGIAYLFIAHDLAVVEHISHRIMVMYLGKIVESGPSREVCRKPRHPYTKALLSAVPTLDLETRRRRIILPGDVPSPLNPPSGCPFHPRCPMAEPRCSEEVPPLAAVVAGNETRHSSACFFSARL